MANNAVRSALRKLVRAKNAAFKGDAVMLQAASQTIREQFNRHVHAPAESVPALLEEVENAVVFLRTNIVQAPLNERGNYVVDAKAIDESKPRQ